MTTILPLSATKAVISKMHKDKFVVFPHEVFSGEFFSYDLLQPAIDMVAHSGGEGWLNGVQIIANGNPYRA